MHYNFARIHQTLRVTPAMEAGVSDHVWEISEIVGLLDWAAAQPSDSNYQPAGSLVNVSKIVYNRNRDH